MEWNEADVWRMLRELRSAPPGKASSGDRQKTFCAAMEQFEQLLMAARAVSAVARPLPLFYALSQAVQAISAANDGPGDWRVFSHGMSWRTGGQLLSSRGEFSGAGGLAKLCDVFNCARNEGTKISFTSAWAALPDLIDVPLSKTALRPLAVSSHFPSNTRIGPRAGIDELPSPTAHLEQFRVRFSDGTTLEAIGDELRQYAGCPEGVQVVSLSFGKGAGAILGWPRNRKQKLASGAMAFEVAAPVGVTHISEGDRWLLPNVDENGSLEVAPLWWIILFATSNFARYSPAAWAKAMDVDQSPSGPRLETMMDRALVRLPRVVLQTLREIANRQEPPTMVEITSTGEEIPIYRRSVRKRFHSNPIHDDEL